MKCTQSLDFGGFCAVQAGYSSELRSEIQENGITPNPDSGVTPVPTATRVPEPEGRQQRVTNTLKPRPRDLGGRSGAVE